MYELDKVKKFKGPNSVFWYSGIDEFEFEMGHSQFLESSPNCIFFLVQQSHWVVVFGFVLSVLTKSCLLQNQVLRGHLLSLRPFR